MKKRPICQMAAAFVVGLLIEYTNIPKSQWMKCFPKISWEMICWLFFGIVVLVIWKWKGHFGKVIVLGGCLLLGQLIMEEAESPCFPNEDNESCQTYQKDSSITVTGCVKSYEIKSNQVYYYLKTRARYHGVLVIAPLSNETSKEQASHQQQVAVGMLIQATGTLWEFTTPTNQGQFHQRLYYKSENLDFSIKNAKVTVLDYRKDWLGDWIHKLQQRLSKQIQQLAGDEYGGILAAMLFGEKTAMDSEDKKLYQRHGIAHVLAISGLHISILGLGLYKLLQKCKCPRWACCVLGGCFVVLFGMLTGMSVSTLRAVVMYLLTMLAQLCGRTYDMPSGVSLAAMLVLLEHPFALFQSGMQFSFGAILGIILLDWLKKNGIGKALDKKVPAFLKGFLVSIHIQLTTLPIQLYHTFYFSLCSALLNLFVIPTMSIVLCFGMAATLWTILFRGALSTVGHFLLFPCKFFLWIYEFSCRMAEQIPGSVQVFGRPKGWQIVLYYVMFALFCIAIGKWKGSLPVYKGKQKRSCMSKRGLQIVAILLLPICMVLSLQNMETSRLKITMLDVGQGECICFQFPNNKVILSDGGSSDVSKVGTYRIKPYLLANGISNVDAVFISHWDEDHVSGIRELLTEQPREIQIKTLVLPKTSGLKDENLRELVEEAESAGVMVQFVQQGSVCTFAEATFTCLWPRKQLVAKNTNEYSGVFSLTYYDFRMLLAGDLPMEYEQELIHTEAGNTEESHGPLQDSMEWDVLKVAHHGSKYSTSPKLLEWIQPRFALISCGAQNSYGHPHEDLLKRLQEAGSKVLSTAECGAITLEIGQEIKMF